MQTARQPAQALPATRVAAYLQAPAQHWDPEVMYWPDRDSGVTREQFRIGGIDIDLSFDKNLNFRLNPQRRTFAFSSIDPHIRISVELVDAIPHQNGIVLFDSERTWKVLKTIEGYRFCFYSPAYGTEPYKVANFSSNFSIGHIYMNANLFSADLLPDPLEYPLDELTLLGHLSNGAGVEIHACGVIDRETGKSFLFAGHSGAGKSTTAQIWEQNGALILSDDRIVITHQDGMIHMHGTPWHGEAQFASPRNAVVDAIFFLHHGRSNHTEHLQKARSAAELFSRSFPTYYNPDGIAFTIAFMDQIAQSVPCSNFYFLPDQTSVGFIRSVPHLNPV